MPTSRDAFDADDLPGYSDAYYPQWLQRAALAWFPVDLVDKYGAKQLSTHDGEFLGFRPDQIDAVLADLTERGFTVERSELDFR